MALINLAGRAALVIGGGTGIGRATALLLAEAGAHTIVLDRHGDRGEAVVAEIRAAGGRANNLCADVTQPTARAAAIASSFELAPTLDLLVNITGSATWIPLLELTDEIWQRDFEINLVQHRDVCQSVVAKWRSQGRSGAICVVGSISGCFASPGHAAYGAAKAGLASFVHTAAEEWRSSLIRINAVVPGSVRTPRIEETLMNPDAPIPEAQLSRMALPEDIAGPITYLVSDLARQVTGQSIVVEAGSSTKFPYALGP